MPGTGIKIVEYTAEGLLVNTFDYRPARFEGCTVQMEMATTTSIRNRLSSIQFLYTIPLSDLDLKRIKPRERRFSRTKITGPLSSDTSSAYMALWFYTVNERKTVHNVSVVTQGKSRDRFEKNQSFFFLYLKNREVAERLARAFIEAGRACGAGEELY